MVSGEEMESAIKTLIGHMGERMAWNHAYRNAKDGTKRDTADFVELSLDSYHAKRIKKTRGGLSGVDKGYWFAVDLYMKDELPENLEGHMTYLDSIATEAGTGKYSREISDSLWDREPPVL